ncbi:hypothetical protein P8452_72957 [Trifolium repens]|nr:hypothetical protein P8452_72957 [Trifolium repens]
MSHEDDIVRMYDGDYEVEADKRKSTYPTALHVIEHRGGDLMLMLSCHGSRKRTSLVENNSYYVETIALDEKTILTDNQIRELAKKAPKGTFLTVVTDACHTRAFMEGASELIGCSCPTICPNNIAEDKLLSRLGGKGFLDQAQHFSVSRFNKT